MNDGSPWLYGSSEIQFGDGPSWIQLCQQPLLKVLEVSCHILLIEAPSPLVLAKVEAGWLEMYR